MGQEFIWKNKSLRNEVVHLDRTKELIQRAQQGDDSAKATLIEENAGLIWSVVKRFSTRGQEVEDIFQIGTIGLLKCIEKFDFTYDVQFSTYAVPMILGEIRRFFRDNGMIKVSRSLKELYLRALRMQEQLQSSQTQEVSIAQLAQALEVPVEELIEAMEAGRSVESLSQSVYQNGEGNEITVEEQLGIEEEDLIVNRIFLQDALKTLAPRERQIISLRYFSDKTETEIAKKLFEKQEEASKDVEGSTPPENQTTQFVGETNGKFKTYDFKIVLEGGQEYYAQITKAGGKLLTLSSHAGRANKTLSNEDAIEIATNFAKAQGLSNMECVWSDVVGNDTYLNLAPVEDNIILYPDLIKVKVDLATGNILGWEATSYYTNHVERNLPSPSYSKAEAKAKISSDFKIVSSRLALSPLEYNREVLTYEFECEKAGATYYFYFNAENGNLENILKVIKTDNGNLLM